jgi:hypothetical protein
VTIGKLSDEVLLNIFRCYLDASPRVWPRLVHICRKWRRIVFSSQRALHLQLFCTHGTPVLKALDYWPALPIVVEYGGSPALDPPADEDGDNILAALRRSDRISSIHLTVTMSLLAKLSSIETPFPNLEDLVLLYEDCMEQGLPSAFRWGPRIRRLHSTGISFPSPLRQLSSSRDIVDIQLHNVVDTAYLSPEVVANALSGMTQLQSLSLQLYSSNPGQYNDIGKPPWSLDRIFLPALAHLKLRGDVKFLDGFVARIDPPLLRDIEITLKGQPYFVSNLYEFIDRIDVQKSHTRAEILFSQRVASISFTQPRDPIRPRLRLSFTPSPSQFFVVLCHYLSPFLSSVEDLRIHATGISSKDNLDSEQWAKLIHPFGGTKWFHIAGDLSTDILISLQLFRKRDEYLLPSLHKLFIWEPEPHHVPLREAAVSLIASRWLSGHIIGLEYERLWINEPHRNGENFVQRLFLSRTDVLGAGTFSQQVSFEMLSDDVLLNVFCHYLDASPQFWPTLTHVCRRWRQIVLGSPLGLRLRLYCTYGTPVLESLECWPPLPLVVNYGGSDTPGPEDVENIIAALKQSDRVSSVNLAVTNSLLENISVISEPFSELEELVLLSRDNRHLVLPSAFRSGPRLRTLHLTRIAIPTLPQLLSPSTGLVNLRLHEIPNVRDFSPDAFANALSELTQLETLSLHFLSLPPRQSYLSLPPQSGERAVLSALTCLEYRGTSKYLDSVVARIDAPHLDDIDITFFSQPTMDTSHLGRFIEGVEMQTLLSEADIQTSPHSISISFSKRGAPTQLRLQISCKRLDWQLSSMTQIFNHLSSFLFRTTDLGILSTQSPSVKDDTDSEQWVELIRTFGGANCFRIAGTYVMDILCALCPVEGTDTIDAIVLPALRDLRVLEAMPIVGSLWDAAQSLITSRRHCGRPVELYVPHFSCHHCNTSFTRQEDLKRHYLDYHPPEHRKFNHLEVAPTDRFSSNPALQSSSHSSSHGSQNYGLYAPDMELFPELKAPSLSLPPLPPFSNWPLTAPSWEFTPPGFGSTMPEKLSHAFAGTPFAHHTITPHTSAVATSSTTGTSMPYSYSFRPTR